ncbi:MAG: gliding motility-associated C-terminal domain-containing protein [Ferruginibacter sp.]
MRRIVLLTIFALSIYTSRSQELSFTCPRDTILGCNTACFTIKAQFPDLRGLADDYTFKEVSTASACRPYADPGGPGPSTNLTIDDRYSAAIALPFSFPFYGVTYNSLVASANGYLSFDVSLAGTFSNWDLTSGNVPNAAYDRALVMGPWHDLDPGVSTSPTMQIKYNVVGNAPNRKWVLSYYKLPLFTNTGGNCNSLIENTHQIILYESTGVIEVYIRDKQICPGWNAGKAMVGLQDFTLTKGIMPPGRQATDPPWGSIGMNETWRFIPKNGSHLYRSVELLDATGAVIATADTTRLDANTFETSFPNICPPAGNSLYVIKTTYQKIDDPTPGATIYSLDTINVIRQAALPVSATMTPTTCGLSTGTITVTVAGGTAPYQYSIDGGALQASNVFTGLAAGPHTVFAQDAGGCNNSVVIIVTSVSSLPSTFVVTATSCPGMNNGTITVTPTAGVAPYTYSIDGGVTSQPGNIFIGLAPGTYTILFTDNLGCTGTQTAIVAAGTAITSTAVTNGTSCIGLNNGSTTVTPTSGTGPYTFTIDGGASQPTGVFTGLAPGSHPVVITDANGCTGTRTVFVNTGVGVTSTFTSTNTSCPGVNNGTITMTPTNGSGPYTYSLDGGAPQASNIITGVAAGLHTITITDATGCTGTKSVSVSIGVGISGASVGTATSCPGVNDGTITTTPSSGTAPFTFSLDGGPAQPTGNFSGVSSGAHNVLIRDVNGCTASAPVNIAAGPALNGSALTTNTSCPTRNDGTISVTASGTAPYTYSLNGGPSQPGNIFSGLAAGTYTVTFTSASGCIGTVLPNPVVSAGPFLTSTFTTFDPPCSNINNGTITVNAITAFPVDITLTLGPAVVGTPGPIFSNLGPGTYNYSFIDANGCTGTGGPVVLTTHSPITTTVALTEPLCNGNANGIITLVASGGVAPYAYSRSPFTLQQPTGVFNGLVTGTYTLRITDNVGCTKDTTVTLGEPALLTASATSPTTASCSGNDGTIVVTGAGGTPAYSYSIDGVNYQAGNSFIAPAVGPYPNIKVKDANGCIANASATVVLVDAMFLTLGPDTTICVGRSVKMLPQTSAGTSIYAWRPLDPLITLPATIDTPTIRNATVTPADTATYILHAQWGACSREDTIVVNILHKPVPNAGLDTAICDRTYAILRGSATNLSGTVNYAWAPPDSVQNPTAAVSIATPVLTQLYTLTVTDNYGCNFSVTDEVLVTVQPPVPAFAGNDTIAIRGAPHQLFGTGGVDYLWTPAAPLNFATAQNPLATLDHDQLFVLKVTDIAGCIGFDTVFVQVYEGPDYYVPNAFSPNGDGVNDIFRAIPVGITKTDYFRVFNRYGQLVFETNQWLKGWDGRYKGKIQPMGVYVWVVKGIDKNGRIVELKGTVMIVQ